MQLLGERQLQEQVQEVPVHHPPLLGAEVELHLPTVEGPAVLCMCSAPQRPGRGDGIHQGNFQQQQQGGGGRWEV